MATSIKTGGGSVKLEGNATAAQVLSGVTFYASDKTLQTGTMTNQGAKTASLNCGGSYTIPAGYHNGSGKITANTLASQTSATATAAQILSGKTAWVNGSKITGNIPTYGNTVSTPYNRDQYGNIGFITNKAGYYPANTIFYNSASSCNILPENIVSGKSIFGVAGTATKVSTTERVTVLRGRTPFVASPGAAVFDSSGVLNLMCSSHHGKYVNGNWTFARQTDGTTRLSIPIEVPGPTAVLYGGAIHAIGASTNEHYKYVNGVWSSVSAGHAYGRRSFSIIGSDGCIYSLGCYSYNYKYNGSSWAQIASLPQVKTNGSSVVILDSAKRINVLGGTDSGMSTTHYRFNGSAWSTLSATPASFSNYPHPAWYDTDGSILAMSIYRLYKFKNEAWTQLSSAFWGEHEYLYSGYDIRTNTPYYVGSNGTYLINGTDLHCFGGNGALGSNDSTTNYYHVEIKNVCY